MRTAVPTQFAKRDIVNRIDADRSLLATPIQGRSLLDRSASIGANNGGIVSAAEFHRSRQRAAIGRRLQLRLRQLDVPDVDREGHKAQHCDQQHCCQHDNRAAARMVEL